MITGYNASQHLMEFKLLNKLFTMFQFPWRFFAPAGAMIIFAAVIWMAESELLNKYRIRALVFAVLIGLNLFTATHATVDREDYAYQSIQHDYTTGHEVKIKGTLALPSTIQYPYEWRIHSVDDPQMMTYIYPTDYENTEIVSYEKEGTSTILTYAVPTPDTMVIFPIMNYQGYHAYDENGNELPITMECDYAVGVACNTDGQEHQIRIYYEIPASFTAATWISLVSILLFGGYLIVKRKFIKK